MKMIVNPQQTQFSDFVRSIPSRFDKEGTVIYKKRNEVRVFNVDGVLLNVKRFKVPIFPNRVIYSFFRPSKAERSFRYSMKLIEKGIDSPEPVACLLTKRGGLLHYSYYISRQLEDVRTFYEFGEGGITGREHILNAFATFTARIHEKGVYHKDYSPGNILFKDNGSEVTFSLVDVNRIQFGPVSVRKGCWNFARLWGHEPLFRLVAEKYAAERQADPEMCVKWVFQAKNQFWSRYLKKHPLPFASDEYRD